MKLYHYRSINSALIEIENGTFHFSSREELNDPLEGYLRVYWQGDKAAWEGLFRNYIQSLFLSVFRYRLGVEGFLHDDKVVLTDTERFDDMPIRKLLDEVGNTFLETKHVKDLVRFYGETSQKCFSSELGFVFYLIHQSAFRLCLKICIANDFFTKEECKALDSLFTNEKRNDFSKYDFYSILSQMAQKMDEKYIEMIKVFAYTYKDLAEAWIMNLSKEVETVLFGQDYKKDNEEITEKGKRRREWLELVIDFPEIYIDQLKALLYPQGYFVCFSEKGNISPMWGNYADNHKGVCLVYETGEKQALNINVNGKGFQQLSVKKVLYDGAVIERNFFETLGRMPFPQIVRWLTGKQGISRCYEAFRDENEWRNKYWEAFEIKNYRKFPSWSYENEFRIQITDFFYNLSDTTKRNFQYAPELLKGVVFGIRTSEFDKKRIFDALYKRSGQFKEFTFYQAEYDEEKQNIEIRKKDVWKL